MTRASPPARPEALELLRCVLGRLPHPRALGEDLHRVAADLLDPVDRLRDAACRGDMGAEEHGDTLALRVRPRPHGPVAHRASCTSETCARRSSTGSSRATQAASFGCGSRTRTRPRGRTRRPSRSRSRCAGSGSTGTARSRSSSIAWSDAQAVGGELVEEGSGVRGRGGDPLPHARRGRDELDDAVNGRIEVPNVAARGSRSRPLGRPPDVQLRLATRGLAGTGSPTSSAAPDHISNTPKQIHVLARGRRRAARLRARAERLRRGRRASSRSGTAPYRSTTSVRPDTCPRR